MIGVVLMELRVVSRGLQVFAVQSEAVVEVMMEASGVVPTEPGVRSTIIIVRFLLKMWSEL